MAENGDVANFTPTAKPKGTWAISPLSSFVMYFLTAILERAREHQPGTIEDQGPRTRQGSRFSFRQFATWEFRHRRVSRAAHRAAPPHLGRAFRARQRAAKARTRAQRSRLVQGPRPRPPHCFWPRRVLTRHARTTTPKANTTGGLSTAPPRAPAAASGLKVQTDFLRAPPPALDYAHPHPHYYPLIDYLPAAARRCRPRPPETVLL